MVRSISLAHPQLLLVVDVQTGMVAILDVKTFVGCSLGMILQAVVSDEQKKLMFYFLSALLF